MSDNELNERAQRLLNLLVTRYVEEGKPVGSQSLARAVNLEVSPATIRNVMSELEQLGYVTSPHTSAGRIPTDKGYRFFVDSLLKVDFYYKNIDESAIKDKVDVEGKNLPGLITSVSHLLSHLTELAGVVTLPKREKLVLRQVEFLPVGKCRVLVILVTNEWEVENKIIQTKNDFSASELEQAANYINDQFGGKDLIEARRELVNDLRSHQESMNNMMLAGLQIAEKAFQSESTEEKPFVLHGESKLLHWAEVSDVEKLRRIFEAFDQKSRILQLLDQSICADGVQIFIGQESGYDEMQELSVVTSSYAADGALVGVLGVIGPTRMNYEKVIPVVNVTARLLSAALNQLK